MKRPHRKLITTACLFLAAACGGGGGTNSAPPAQVAQCDDLVPTAQSLYVLPYTVGESYRVNQANCSGFGHSNFWQFGYDFVMDIGTVVTAARGGTGVFGVCATWRVAIVRAMTRRLLCLVLLLPLSESTHAEQALGPLDPALLDASQEAVTKDLALVTGNAEMVLDVASGLLQVKGFGKIIIHTIFQPLYLIFCIAPCR